MRVSLAIYAAFWLFITRAAALYGDGDSLSLAVTEKLPTHVKAALSELHADVSISVGIAFGGTGAPETVTTVESVRILPQRDYWVKLYSRDWLWLKTPQSPRPFKVPGLGIDFRCVSPFVERRALQVEDFRVLSRLGIQSLNLDETEATTELLGPLRNMGLKEVYLGGTLVDNGIRSLLASWWYLRRLDLHDTNIDDHALTGVRDLKKMETLYLGGTHVSGTAFSTLGNLSTLKVLYLHGTSIGDKSVKDLTRFANLTELSIAETNVTGRSASLLRSMHSVRSLDCGGLPFTDGDMEQLVRCKRLRTLYLDGTRITDRGLQFLAHSRSLEELNVSFTNVSEAGVRSVEDSNQSLRIRADHLTLERPPSGHFIPDVLSLGLYTPYRRYLRERDLQRLRNESGRDN